MIEGDEDLETKIDWGRRANRGVDRSRRRASRAEDEEEEEEEEMRLGAWTQRGSALEEEPLWKPRCTNHEVGEIASQPSLKRSAYSHTTLASFILLCGGIFRISPSKIIKLYALVKWYDGLGLLIIFLLD